MNDEEENGMGIAGLDDARSRIAGFGGLGTLVLVCAAILAVDSSAAGAPGPLPVVSTAWLGAHLEDPLVRVIYTGDEAQFRRGHIPGARFIDHMATLGPGHRLLPVDALAANLAKAGAADGVRVVLYGDSPMTTGWLFMAFASLGHADSVSMLDGNMELWRAEGRPVSTATPAPATGRLTARTAADVIVDARWVRSHLGSPAARVLDVRTTREWDNGHLPGATLVLWQDLFEDLQTLKLRSEEERRALFARAGVEPGQQVITYCAIGMRASLMYWAAWSVGLPARVYVGSFEDWRRDQANPVAR